MVVMVLSHVLKTASPADAWKESGKQKIKHEKRKRYAKGENRARFFHVHPRLEEPKTWAVSGYIRPFSSCSKPLFQDEAKSEAIDIKMIFLFSCK